MTVATRIYTTSVNPSAYARKLTGRCAATAGLKLNSSNRLAAMDPLTGGCLEFVRAFEVMYERKNQDWQTLYYVHMCKIYEHSGINLPRDRGFKGDVFFAACMAAYWRLVTNCQKRNKIMDSSTALFGTDKPPVQ